MKKFSNNVKPVYEPKVCQYLVFSSKVGYALSRGVWHTMRDCPHEKEQRLKTFGFERWCDRLQLPTATRDFVLLLLLAASRDVS